MTLPRSPERILPLLGIAFWFLDPTDVAVGAPKQSPGELVWLH